MSKQFAREETKLLRHIGNEDVVRLLKHAKCFVAGGAVTSMFSGKEINDIDVYFRDYESLVVVLKNLFSIDDADESDDKDLDKAMANFLDIGQFQLIYTNHTKKSVLFVKDELHLQLIYFKFFQTPQEIFDTFDFTVNMGVYDFAAEEFVLHDDFLKDVAQRRLMVNPKTAYPIISLLRIDKYKGKGYEISRKEFVKLCLAVNNLKITSWEMLEDVIGGMYGYTYGQLFDTTEPFSIENAIAQLERLESNLESTSTIRCNDYYTIIDEIDTNLGRVPNSETRVFYKAVSRSDDGENRFRSFHTPSFVYEIGKVVNGGSHGIWGYKTVEGAKQHYGGYTINKHKAIIKIRPTKGCEIKRDGRNTFNIKGDIEVLEEVKE